MEHKLSIDIKWENDNYFEVSAKKDSGGKFIVIRNDENTHLLDIWPNVEKSCIQYIRAILKNIKSDMSK